MNTPTPALTSPIRNSYWAVSGKVLAGEHPTAATPEATRERLQRLIDAGVECFIDLTEPGEVKPYDPELPLSIEYLRKPIRDHGTPTQRAHMAEILDCIHDALQSGRCVYVHCRAGIGRTGTVIGCLLVERGFANEAALDELNRVWQQCERSQSWASIPETDNQVTYVRDWKPRAVFAEELSLASVAARNALVGKSALPPTTATSATVGARAILGMGGEGATPNVHTSSANTSVPSERGVSASPSSAAANMLGNSPGSPGTTSASGSPEPVLAGLGLPMLDDDEDDDFQAFRKGRGGAPAATPRAGATPTTQSGEWPSFGEPRSSTRSHVGPTAGRGAQPTGANLDRPSPGAAGGPGATEALGAFGAAGSPAAFATPGSSGASPGTPTAFTTPGAPGASGAPTAFATPSSPGVSSAPSASATPGALGVPTRGASGASGPRTASASPGAPTSAGDARTPAVPTPNTTPDPDDPLSDPAALSAARGLRERFLGALLGMAVGDAVAAPTQFRKPGTFTPIGDMIGGGPFDLPRGAWSDDTAMALCLADSLLERNGSDPRDQMERYRRWQQEGYLTSTGQCVGITASTARAIAMSAWRRGAVFGSHDPSQLDPEPLSRVAPAVLFFFAASGQAVEQAAEAARSTCQAPAVLEACRSLARALHAALSGQPKAAVLEKAVQAIGNTPGRTSIGISASAALTAAVAAFGATANFRDAVLYAANLGGDSDVICAVCGQLAGAYYSVKAIPTSWHNGLMRKDLIVSYADRLLAHAMLGLSG